MESPSIFVDQQNKYCNSGYINESDLQIQCNPHQNPNYILHRNRKKIQKQFIWKHKRPGIAKAILGWGIGGSNAGGNTIPHFK
jgi:hypothetical protein